MLIATQPVFCIKTSDVVHCDGVNADGNWRVFARVNREQPQSTLNNVAQFALLSQNVIVVVFHACYPGLLR